MRASSAHVRHQRVAALRHAERLGLGVAGPPEPRPGAAPVRGRVVDGAAGTRRRRVTEREGRRKELKVEYHDIRFMLEAMEGWVRR